MLNEWHAKGALEGVYDPIEVKTINLDEASASPDRSFDYATKLDRDPRFLDLLWDHGREQAERFLATERDRRRVRRSLETGWAAKREAPADEWVAPAFQAHLPTGLAQLDRYLRGESPAETGPMDFEAVLAFGTRFQEAVPDLQYEIGEMIAEPGAVATRWTSTGTHTGPLLDLEPTGREITLSGMRIDHLQDGRLAETWLLTEQWSLLRQVEGADTETPVSTMRRVTSTPVVTQLSAPAENEELARILVEDVWNGGERERLTRALDPGCVLFLDDRDDLVGRDAFWAFVSRYRDAFPDLTVTIEDVVSEGDKIALRQRVSGTHEGPVLGVEATGERVDVSRMVIHHVDDGRIVETGIVEDTVGLLQQLGAPIESLEA
jgi:predicted ester cyclase